MKQSINSLEAAIKERLNDNADETIRLCTTLFLRSLLSEELQHLCIPILKSRTELSALWMLSEGFTDLSNENQTAIILHFIHLICTTSAAQPLTQNMREAVIESFRLFPSLKLKLEPKYLTLLSSLCVSNLNSLKFRCVINYALLNAPDHTSQMELLTTLFSKPITFSEAIALSEMIRTENLFTYFILLIKKSLQDANPTINLNNLLRCIDLYNNICSSLSEDEKMNSIKIIEDAIISFIRVTQKSFLNCKFNQRLEQLFDFVINFSNNFINFLTTIISHHSNRLSLSSLPKSIGFKIVKKIFELLQANETMMGEFPNVLSDLSKIHPDIPSYIKVLQDEIVTKKDTTLPGRDSALPPSSRQRSVDFINECESIINEAQEKIHNIEREEKKAEAKSGLYMVTRGGTIKTLYPLAVINRMAYTSRIVYYGRRAYREASTNRDVPKKSRDKAKRLFHLSLAKSDEILRLKEFPIEKLLDQRVLHFNDRNDYYIALFLAYHVKFYGEQHTDSEKAMLDSKMMGCLEKISLKSRLHHPLISNLMIAGPEFKELEQNSLNQTPPLDTSRLFIQNDKVIYAPTPDEMVHGPSCISRPN